MPKLCSGWPRLGPQNLKGEPTRLSYNSGNGVGYLSPPGTSSSHTTQTVWMFPVGLVADNIPAEAAPDARKPVRILSQAKSVNKVKTVTIGGGIAQIRYAW